MIYLNGEYISKQEAKVSVFDRGYLFADGIYEVVPIFYGQGFMEEEHISRLKKSLKEIKINNFKDDVKQIFSSLLKAEDDDYNGMLYLQVTRGVQEKRNHSYLEENLSPSVMAYLQPLPKVNKDLVQKGFSAITHEDFRWQRCDIKSIALLPNVMIKSVAEERGAVEAILVRNKIVTEATASNVFIVKNNELITHPADSHILSGITRQFLIKIAKELDISVVERKFGVNELMSADEVLVSSSTKLVMPILEVDKNKIGLGVAGPIWSRLFDSFLTKIQPQ